MNAIRILSGKDRLYTSALWPVAFLAIVAGQGCWGTEVPMDMLPVCEAVITELDLDEECRYGFTGREVLERFEGVRGAQFEYVEGQTTDLTQELKYLGGVLRVIERVPPEGVDEYEIDSCHAPQFEMEFELTFSTADGAFSEVLSMTYINNQLVQGMGTALSVKADQLQGSWDGGTDISISAGFAATTSQEYQTRPCRGEIWSTWADEEEVLQEAIIGSWNGGY